MKESIREEFHFGGLLGGGTIFPFCDFDNFLIPKFVVRKKMPPLFSVLSSVLCFEFIFSATHKCNTLCHVAITVQATIF